MADWDDELAGLNSEVLTELGGEPVTYQRASGGSPFTVIGILKDPRQYESFSPGVVAILWVRASDFSPLPVAGDKATIGSTIYYVVQSAEDAGGGIDLALNKKQ